ncbi:enoyl-CoA hydratase [Ahrensia sp. R2A130]|uniref:enoyl-CoA hydratase n=1 Tax=Ahrensia sp. R2A130 TaxID=744979 RepID=UPI0001E08C21|nr:enoyl-CoA hydratase [Ahrensia sp. R2A130]EFL90560.1 enoyl-CoA hydratase domain-containing protein 3 [Ahrensia sp. R2A130]
MAEIVNIKTAEAMGDAPVVVQLLEGGITRLVLNHPPANALSDQVIADLMTALERAEGDDTRVIILAANGHLFCAGHDLKEVTAAREAEDGGRAYFTDLMVRCSELMQAIVNHRCPIIAEVNGLATAAGAQLVASCDLAIASEDAAFCTPGVHIGLFCSTPMVALSRNVHRKHAMEMLLTGEAITPSHAREIGLINRVVPVDYLQKITLQYARNIAKKSSHTLKMGKQAFYQQADMPLAEAYAHAAEVMVENMLVADAKEGIGAFLESRDPEWTDG